MSNMTRYLLNDLFNDMPSRLSLRSPRLWDEEAALNIKLDINENENNYIVQADIPGVKKEDIKVDINGNQLYISAEVKRSTEEKIGRVLRSERYEGTVSRNLTLPSEIEATKAEAKYDNGVLILTLPKAAGSQQKSLKIQ